MSKEKLLFRLFKVSKVSSPKPSGNFTKCKITNLLHTNINTTYVWKNTDLNII